MKQRLVEWDRLQVRILGSRIAVLAREAVRRSGAPVEIQSVDFRAGDAEIAGTLRKGLALPFSFHLRTIAVEGRTLRLPIEQLTVAGFLPVPTLLFRLAEGFGSMKGVAIDPERKTVIVSVDRFLPEFVDVEIEAVRIIETGVEVTLGRGGADPPGAGGGW
ncbi:MAG TPA: hypothetical protein VLV48_03150 [Thermoanaerobaculia bacterium]|nr:hypothetical protein [Thermoanaerobaculia bacterium]